MSPSPACSQLHSRCMAVTLYSPSGNILDSMLGRGGGVSRSPIYVHTTPPRSWHGYATARTFVRKSDSAGSLGISTHAPDVANFHPWYTHLRPPSSFLPKNSEAPRCGQLCARRPTRPVE